MSRRHTLRLAKQRAAAKREEPSGLRWPYFRPYALTAEEHVKLAAGEIVWVDPPPRRFML